jgi:hypothetical protein
MKKIFCLLGILLALSLSAQKISHSVIGTAGNKNFTIGQVSVLQTKTTNAYLISGFHQPLSSKNPIIALISSTEDEVSLYPNPVVDELNIVTSKYVSFHVYNMNGVETQSGNGNIIDFRNSASGIYIVNVNNKNYKIVKE